MDRSASLSKLNIVAIFAVFAGFAEFVILSPALNALQLQFPNESFTTIMLANTISGVVSVPVAIFVGATANKVGYRPYAILAYIFMIAGCYPFFLTEITVYWPIILSRVLVGIGTGLLFPIAGALVMYYFEGKKRAIMLGVSVVVQYVFAMTYTQVSGILASIAWNYTFLTYLISVIPLVLIIAGLKESKHEIAESERKEKEQYAGIGKKKIDNRIWIFVVLGFMVANLVISINFLSSLIVEQRGIGNAAAAGTMGTFFNAGCLCAGLLYGMIVNKIGKWAMPLFAAIGAIGSIWAYFTGSVVGLYIAAFMVGITDMMLFTSCQNCVGNLTHPTRLAFTNGIMSIMLNFGSFTGSYFLTACQVGFPQLGMAAPLMISGIIFAILAVIFLFMKFKPLTTKMYEGATEEE